MTIEEIADTLSAATTRATKALREVSNTIAELREIEVLLKAIANAQAIVADSQAAKSQQPTEDENARLAYSIPELAEKLGVHRRTIERAIDAKRIIAVRVLGHRRVTAASVKALFDESEPPLPAGPRDTAPRRP